MITVEIWYYKNRGSNGSEAASNTFNPHQKWWTWDFWHLNPCKRWCALTFISHSFPTYLWALCGFRFRDGWRSTHLWRSFGGGDCCCSVGLLWAFIGTSVHFWHSRFSGIVTAQTFSYFKDYAKDPKRIKHLVGKLFACFLFNHRLNSQSFRSVLCGKSKPCVRYF